jgi:hypothetical protein
VPSLQFTGCNRDRENDGVILKTLPVSLEDTFFLKKNVVLVEVCEGKGLDLIRCPQGRLDPRRGSFSGISASTLDSLIRSIFEPDLELERG